MVKEILKSPKHNLETLKTDSPDDADNLGEMVITEIDDSEFKDRNELLEKHIKLFITDKEGES